MLSTKVIMSIKLIYFSGNHLAVVLSLLISSQVIAKSNFQLDLGRLWLDRVGEDANAYMRTTSVLTPVLSPRSSFIIKGGTVTPSPVSSGQQILATEIMPPRAKIKGEWYGENEGETEGSILGGIGEMILNEKIINIPVVIASPENLAYYGVRLIKDGEIMDVESPVPLVIAGVTVGENYIKGFIMRREHGGGEYLEYHDTPHFHMPLNKDADGVLILGKQDDNSYYVTAYKIPFGYGIYTPPNVLHSDAHLLGHYLVMYTYTNNFSTVNLKTQTGELVQVQFSPQYQVSTESLDLPAHPESSRER